MLPLCPLTPYGGAGAVGSNIKFTPLRIWAQGPNDIPLWLGRVSLNLAAIPGERESEGSRHISHADKTGQADILEPPGQYSLE